MKRVLITILGSLFSSLIVITSLDSCEVDHFYDAEITVVNPSGDAMPGFSVRAVVEVDNTTILDESVSQEKITNDNGKVFFEFNNVAILKIEAVEGSDFNNENATYGEALLVLEEDKTIQISVVVYD